jgi:hypothetical protein
MQNDAKPENAIRFCLRGVVHGDRCLDCEPPVVPQEAKE